MKDVFRSGDSSKKFRFAFFFSSRRRHTRSLCDWSSDVCSSDLVGTGCGCIALALATEGRFDRVIAVERSPAAAALARENVALVRPRTRVEIREGDLLAPLAGRSEERRVGKGGRTRWWPDNATGA